MNIVRYDTASNQMTFRFPTGWDPELVTAVSIVINDTVGNDVLASTPATLQASTTLRSGADRFATTLNIDSGYAGDVAVGDLLKVVGIGGSEVVVVKGYDSANKDVEIDGVLQNEYAAADTVYPMYASYILDTTDTDVFLNGLRLVVKWTPTGAGNATTEQYQVLQTALELGDFEGKFRHLYPRAYDVLTKTAGRFDSVRDTAEMRLYCDLQSDGMDLYQIKEQRVIAPVMMALTAYLAMINGDEDTIDERKVLLEDYDDRLGTLKRLPVWIDTNLDLVEDDEEVSSHQTYFERGW